MLKTVNIANAGLINVFGAIENPQSPNIPYNAAPIPIATTNFVDNLFMTIPSHISQLLLLYI